MTTPAAVVLTVAAFGLLFSGACLGYMLRETEMQRAKAPREAFHG